MVSALEGEWATPGASIILQRQGVRTTPSFNWRKNAHPENKERKARKEVGWNPSHCSKAYRKISNA